jgi:hypothetical protein
MRIKYTDAGHKGVNIDDGKQTLSGDITTPRIAEAVNDFWAHGGIIEEADPEPTIPRMLSKLTLVDRVIARGRMDIVLAVLDDPLNKIAKARYDAAQELAADPEDPMIRPLLKAAGYTDEEVTEDLRA